MQVWQVCNKLRDLEGDIFFHGTVRLGILNFFTCLHHSDIPNRHVLSSNL